MAQLVKNSFCSADKCDRWTLSITQESMVSFKKIQLAHVQTPY